MIFAQYLSKICSAISTFLSFLQEFWRSFDHNSTKDGRKLWLKHAHGNAPCQQIEHRGMAPGAFIPPE
jgi:hypothetical protein